MGDSNQPKHRQEKRELARRKASRRPFDRILIISEGEKTELNYLDELRQSERLSTANICVVPSAIGTEPLQVVTYAETIFKKGDVHRGVVAKEFDRIYVVFDRDSHRTYHDALVKSKALDGVLRNEIGDKVRFIAIPSVPCFEVWLLMHFEEVHAPLHRKDVYSKLNAHLKDYQKGQKGYWALTKDRLPLAEARALTLSASSDPLSGIDSYTDMHSLVKTLLELKSN